MTSDILSGAAGISLSLIFSYFPGFSAWFAGLHPDAKRLIMLVALLAVGVIVFTGSCAGFWDYAECSQDGALLILRAFVLAAITNQTMYQLSPGIKASIPREPVHPDDV